MQYCRIVKDRERKGEEYEIKKILVSVLACAALLTSTGCNAITIDGEDNSGAVPEGSGAIGFSVSTLNNPFFVSLSDGAKAAAKAEGADLIVVDAGDDAAKQTSDIEDLISRNVSVLIVNPVDSDAVGPVVKDALAAVGSGKMTATVAQKPEVMGETAVLTALKMIQGETVEKSIPVEVELVK